MAEQQDSRISKVGKDLKGSLPGGWGKDNSLWYRKNISPAMFSDAMRTNLPNYSKVPEDQIEKYIHNVVRPSSRFAPAYTTSNYYEEQSPIIHETARQILGLVSVYDGALSENLFGSDLEAGFFNLGYDLFNDRETLRSEFIAADALAGSSPLDKLDGTVSIIHESSLFHLFSRDFQIKLGFRCVKLLKASPGSLTFGRQTGNENAGVDGLPDVGLRDCFGHNAESWRDMWDGIADRTGTKWKVDVYLYQDDLESTYTEGRRRMRFVMWLE